MPRSPPRSEEHTSELQSLRHLVCRLLLEKKKKKKKNTHYSRLPIVQQYHTVVTSVTGVRVGLGRCYWCACGLLVLFFCFFFFFFKKPPPPQSSPFPPPPPLSD